MKNVIFVLHQKQSQSPYHICHISFSFDEIAALRCFLGNDVNEIAHIDAQD